MVEEAVGEADLVEEEVVEEAVEADLVEEVVGVADLAVEGTEAHIWSKKFWTDGFYVLVLSLYYVLRVTHDPKSFV